MGLNETSVVEFVDADNADKIDFFVSINDTIKRVSTEKTILWKVNGYFI
jgi:hypothetical protein